MLIRNECLALRLSAHGIVTFWRRSLDRYMSSPPRVVTIKPNVRALNRVLTKLETLSDRLGELAGPLEAAGASAEVRVAIGHLEVDMREVVERLTDQVAGRPRRPPAPLGGF